MSQFQPGQKVRVTKNGVTVDGEIRSGRQPFYPDSTVTKYGGHMGRMAWGYKVSAPIVQKDGSVYMVRGRVANGLGFVEETNMEAAR